MHPLFFSQRSFLAVLLFWFVISTFITLLIIELLKAESIQGLVEECFSFITPWYFILIFFCFSNIHLCQRLPINRTPIFFIVIFQSIAGVFTVGLWLILGYIWSAEAVHLGIQHGREIYQLTFITNGVLATILYAVWVLLHYTYLTANTSEADNSEILRKRLLISEIELKTLKETVHPHFMYNSLNMLANLSQVTPEKIHGLCVQIADFLRYSVNYSKSERVTVAEEVTHIKNYLSIEQERYGQRCIVDFNIADKANSTEVIPLILFPLVENAVKHGIDASLEKGYIKIAIQKNDVGLQIEVKNSTDPLGGNRKGTGLGLSSLKKRLAGYYGSNATMVVESDDHEFVVKLHLPNRIPSQLRKPTGV